MKVGDKVVCIDDSEWYGGYYSEDNPTPLVKDKIYTILKIAFNGAQAVNSDMWLWDDKRFRKVEPFKNKLTQELAIQVLTNQPQTEIERIEIKEKETV